MTVATCHVVLFGLRDDSTRVTLKFATDMADKGARSARKSSVRVVVSSPETSTKSSFTSTRKDVMLRQQGARLGQSVSHTISDDVPHDDPEIPLLLEVPDDEEEDEELSKAMEEEFFGAPQSDDTAEKEKQQSVCVYISRTSLDDNQVLGSSGSRLGSISSRIRG
jgi:hypothetical protein